MTPCFLVDLHRHFIQSHCFHNHKWWTFYPENEGSRILGNGGKCLIDYTASYFRRQYCILHNSCSLRPVISVFSTVFLINHVILIYACWFCILFKRSKISLFCILFKRSQTSAYYNVISCCLATIYRNVGGIFDTDSTLKMDRAILQNFGFFLQDYTVSHPRRQQSNFTFPHMAKHSAVSITVISSSCIHQTNEQSTHHVAQPPWTIHSHSLRYSEQPRAIPTT